MTLFEVSDHRVFSFDSRCAARDEAGIFYADVIELVIAEIAGSSELSVAKRAVVLFDVHVNPVEEDLGRIVVDSSKLTENLHFCVPFELNRFLELSAAQIARVFHIGVDF